MDREQLNDWNLSLLPQEGGRVGYQDVLLSVGTKGVGVWVVGLLAWEDPVYRGGN